MLRRRRQADATPPDDRPRRSSRVGRFGPRSLTARLLTIMLVPMLGLQVLAYREVQRYGEAADGAGQILEQARLLQHASQLLRPFYFEFTATLGLSRAEEQQIPRESLNDVIGLDFMGILADARVELDDHLAGLRAGDGAVRLPDGRTVADLVDTVDTHLTTMRTAFDAHEQPVEEAAALRAEFASLLEQIETRGHQLRLPSGNTSLVNIALELDQLVDSLALAGEELAHLADVGTTGTVNRSLVDLVKVAGGFDASIAQLRDELSPERRPALDELLASPSFAAVATALPTFLVEMVEAAQTGETLFRDQNAVRSIIDVMLASFERLTDLQTFADQFVAEDIRRIERIESDAQRNRVWAIVVMVGAGLASLVLLVLVVRSILRPLRRLALQSRQVGDGDLAVEPAKPSGPTDIRVVMRTFNDMVASLRAYDTQVGRLARGDTSLDESLPGPLGEKLRQSVSHLTEVTQRLHESEAAANRQARTDPLTGLANRTRAIERLAEMAVDAQHHDRRGAVVFLDLDGFKSVNDTEGHAEGDRILAEIGERLRNACTDDLVARIGGDEFLVLIERADNLDDLTVRARDLLALIARPCTGTAGRTYTLSASAGIALVDANTNPLDGIARADSAVYHAKERGRGRVEVFDERLAKSLEDRAAMALTMRTALSDGQFELALQPIIDLDSMEPVGAEALLRWNHPEQGEVLPNQFIPIAERTEVIVDLERWVLEQAVNILRDWRIDPLTAHLRLAVNISGRHIVEGHLAELIEVLCRRAVVDPSLLDLEITETHLVADVGRAGLVVDDLRDQGIHVAIDDFGTGYSSMSYLHQLTVDTLKIDRVFIAGMGDDRLDRTIVELLLRLGDSMRLKVVAEGVDNEDTLAALRSMGCHYAQGFHIARPMPVDDATAWLRARVAAAAGVS